MSEIDVAVWGSTGFAGKELLGILEEHPQVANIRSVDREIPADLDAREVVFLALPHGVSGKIAAKLAKLGNMVLDLSGDLRFETAEEYEKWYHEEHPAPELLPAPYALPELFREDIENRQVISIPGCYPTATLLGSVPLVEQELIKPDSQLTVNAVSGVSGRGKKPTPLNHFMNISGNAILYNTGRVHRHVGEIEQFLDDRSVVFSPMVIPVERGMLVQTTARLVKGVNGSDIAEVFEEAYGEEALVNVLEEDSLPNIHDTVRTDGCKIGYLMADASTVHIVSSLDNLRKGAASQAVQAFNLAKGLPELSGLKPL